MNHWPVFGLFPTKCEGTTERFINTLFEFGTDPAHENAFSFRPYPQLRIHTISGQPAAFVFELDMVTDGVPKLRHPVSDRDERVWLIASEVFDQCQPLSLFLILDIPNIIEVKSNRAALTRE